LLFLAVLEYLIISKIECQQLFEEFFK